MSDETWRDLREPWQRLQWARRHWQAASGSALTARAAAESLGMKEDTYSAYERRPDASKATPLTHQRAIQFGRKFKVRWEWLLTGDGEPWPTEGGPRARILQAVDEAAADDPDELERKADAIVTLLRAARR